MSRPLRIEYPGAWYHVMNRGRKAENIFSEKSDYQVFIDLLKECSELWNVNISTFCLMPNHSHLLIQTPDADLSRCIENLNRVYTNDIKRKKRPSKFIIFLFFALRKKDILTKFLIYSKTIHHGNSR